MAGCAQSARSRHLRKRYKCPAINRLRVKGDKVREGSWRVGASLLQSDLALADMQYAMGDSAWCKISLAASPFGLPITPSRMVKNLAVSLADDIHDAAPQGEPRKLQKLFLRSSRVVYLPLLHGARCVCSIGTPDLKRVR